MLAVAVLLIVVVLMVAVALLIVVVVLMIVVVASGSQQDHLCAGSACFVATAVVDAETCQAEGGQSHQQRTAQLRLSVVEGVCRVVAGHHIQHQHHWKHVPCGPWRSGDARTQCGAPLVCARACTRSAHQQPRPQAPHVLAAAAHVLQALQPSVLSVAVAVAAVAEEAQEGRDSWKGQAQGRPRPSRGARGG